MNDGYRLGSNRYGKAHVRLAKVKRGADGTHELTELEAQILATGDFRECYEVGDNASILPTDTIKNTVYGLAAQTEIRSIEEFGLVIGQHLLQHSRFMGGVVTTLQETSWDRLNVSGTPHPHAFIHRQPHRAVAEVSVPREGAPRLTSGIDGLTILKTTASAFSGYLRDEWTTLPETRDRFFCTIVRARWDWRAAPKDYRRANAAALDAMLHVFATEFSESVQATMWSMGKAAMEAVSEIARVSLALPNRHYLPVDVTRFGLPERHEIFLPTDEPHGQIEAVIERAGP